jgi:hypothetical protein
MRLVFFSLVFLSIPTFGDVVTSKYIANRLQEFNVRVNHVTSTTFCKVAIVDPFTLGPSSGRNGNQNPVGVRQREIQEKIRILSGMQRTRREFKPRNLSNFEAQVQDYRYYLVDEFIRFEEEAILKNQIRQLTEPSNSQLALSRNSPQAQAEFFVEVVMSNFSDLDTTAKQYGMVAFSESFLDDQMLAALSTGSGAQALSGLLRTLRASNSPLYHYFTNKVIGGMGPYRGQPMDIGSIWPTSK